SRSSSRNVLLTIRTVAICPAGGEPFGEASATAQQQDSPSRTGVVGGAMDPPNTPCEGRSADGRVGPAPGVGRGERPWEHRTSAEPAGCPGPPEPARRPVRGGGRGQRPAWTSPPDRRGRPGW